MLRTTTVTISAILGIALMATTMRGTFTSVGPLLETIRGDTALSTAGAGALGMLPLLAFAAISPLAPNLSRKIGLERALALALIAIAIGVAIRSTPGVVLLFAG